MVALLSYPSKLRECVLLVSLFLNYFTQMAQCLCTVIGWNMVRGMSNTLIATLTLLDGLHRLLLYTDSNPLFNALMKTCLFPHPLLQNTHIVLHTILQLQCLCWMLSSLEHQNIAFCEGTRFANYVYPSRTHHSRKTKSNHTVKQENEVFEASFLFRKLNDRFKQQASWLMASHQSVSWDEVVILMQRNGPNHVPVKDTE